MNKQWILVKTGHISESHYTYIWGGGNFIFEHSSLGSFLHNLALSESRKRF